MAKKIRDCQYHECMAKVVLERYMPEKYKNLELSDKPDLKDHINNIGVEVTIGDNPLELKEYAINLRKLKKLVPEDTYKVEWELLIPCDVEKYPYKHILDVFQRKVERLNHAGYEIFQENNLLIEITQCWIKTEKEAEFLLEHFIKHNSDTVKYRYVYLSCRSMLHVFDLQCSTYHNIPNASQSDCLRRALDLAERNTQSTTKKT